ncbi:16S rRNA (cytosine(967)-C(5))-methyltransferase RsmB [Isobaculum melis]|uniref:16S rRNA (cytosine(967)-C(5))-methyltransferase n=1 Tax=Isobaculum melis TaxID=142588 RepID=A0A1H9RAP2_9LACT|nr:16S rRNA (cytosine(967)-C(5))-methyltransferase RsmB [Isobaculum melis]SER69615.1 16S rRNA (cytosine967-C5)-methyltransferase [Isobaculum melis]
MTNQENEQKRNIKKTARYLAVDILEKTEKQGSYSNLLLNHSIEKNKLGSADSGLLTELVYGTIQRRMTLDYFLSPFIQENKKLEMWVRNLLRISVYQMVYLDKVPLHAVLFEAGEIAKRKGHIGISKLVNGVLRNAERKGFPSFSEIADPVTRLSIEISMPQWLVEKLIDQIGIEKTEELGYAILEPSKVSGRVNEKFLTRAEAIDALEEAGLEAYESEVSPVGIIVERGNLAHSPLYQSGQLTVQDESSMLVAPALQLAPHDLVLDACAAPGGKTTHIASYLDAGLGGKVVALDLHAHKTKLIEANAQRMHVDQVVETKTMDARKVDEVFEDGLFDRILVDAPCSGLGLMRRKPDIKYTKTKADFKNLQRIQLEILDSVAKKVKECGIIVYSTCTITEEENFGTVTAFLKEHPAFELVAFPVDERLQESVHNDCLQIYPHEYGTDGFFISCLQRKKEV